MDIATLFGLLGGVAIIIAAVASGSDLFIFLNLPGVLIVLGGTAAATLIKFPLNRCIKAFQVAYQAFRRQLEAPEDLIRRIHELAHVVRRRGILALDGEEVNNEFFQKGIQLMVDGHPAEFVRKALKEDMRLSIERHDQGQRIFRAVGESAPAFGMIGTLIGLVQMLVNLDNPDAIGPAMAVALLTTLYGALIANLFALPIADKLELRGQEEALNKQLIIEGLAAIQEGTNPRVMDEVLEAYLPRRERERLLTELESMRPNLAAEQE